MVLSFYKFNSAAICAAALISCLVCLKGVVIRHYKNASDIIANALDNYPRYPLNRKLILNWLYQARTRPIPICDFNVVVSKSRDDLLCSGRAHWSAIFKLINCSECHIGVGA